MHFTLSLEWCIFRLLTGYKQMSFHCQICEREIKATTGVIAHHGYTRPGWGQQTRSCDGARELPYEVSRDAIKPAINGLRIFLGNQKSRLQEYLEAPEKITRRSAYFAPVVY